VNITLLQNIVYQSFAAFLFYNLRILGAIGCNAAENHEVLSEAKSISKALLNSDLSISLRFSRDDDFIYWKPSN
jgi:hypothetical protein